MPSMGHCPDPKECPARPLAAQLIPALLTARRLLEPGAQPTRNRLQNWQWLQLPSVLHKGF